MLYVSYRTDPEATDRQLVEFHRKVVGPGNTIIVDQKIYFTVPEYRFPKLTEPGYMANVVHPVVRFLVSLDDFNEKSVFTWLRNIKTANMIDAGYVGNLIMKYARDNIMSSISPNSTSVARQLSAEARTSIMAYILLRKLLILVQGSDDIPTTTIHTFATHSPEFRSVLRILSGAQTGTFDHICSARIAFESFESTDVFEHLMFTSTDPTSGMYYNIANQIRKSNINLSTDAGYIKNVSAIKPLIFVMCCFGVYGITALPIPKIWADLILIGILIIFLLSRYCNKD